MTKEKQHQFDISYLKMAKIWAENSYAIRLKVGCLIVKDGMIISDGFNGTLRGFPNTCEYAVMPSGNKVYTDDRNYLLELRDKGAALVTKDDVVHSEMNALLKCSRHNVSCDGATIYISACPCINCAKHIIQANIRRVVYADEYRNHDGVDLLKKANIEVEQINIE